MAKMAKTLRWIFYAPGIPFHGGSIQEGYSLGGSESACFYLAREAVRAGHKVDVFSNISSQQAGTWEGVNYFSAGNHPSADLPGIDCINAVRSVAHDVLVSQRMMRAFIFPTAARCHLWWAHDMPEVHLRPQMRAQGWNIDAIMAVSNFHKQALTKIYNWPQKDISVIPNAVDSSLFSLASSGNNQRVGKRLFYSSCPERGLEHLVGGADGKPSIMEQLLKQDPEITLFVCNYDNSPPWIKELHQFLEHRCRILPNVRWLGHLSKAELARQMMQAWLHVYPTRFPEVSCITAMETQFASLPILCTSSGALEETLRGGGAIWVPLTESNDELRTCFVKEILALSHSPSRWMKLQQQTQVVRDRISWESSFKIAEALVHKKLQQEELAKPERLAMSLLRKSPPPISRLKEHLEEYPQHRSKLMKLARKKYQRLLLRQQIDPNNPSLTPATCPDTKLAQAAVLSSAQMITGLPAGLWLKPLITSPPPQTVSVCILTKVREAGLANCLASVASVADEWIIGLDEESPHSATELRTVKSLIRGYRGRILSLPSPLHTGFAAARNQLLRAAAAEWVLWLDADEILTGKKHLGKYLRDNIFNAYAIPQHHFSLQPPGLLKTDLPCRLLRSSSKFQFQGMVHEHPEQGGGGPGQVFVLPDVTISHQGYLTEDSRRRRFLRNLPLMKQERADNLQRPLNNFLWIRDLTQLNRFEQEQTGKVGTDATNRAKEAVDLWRHLVQSKHSQLALDALPYYSECVRILQGPYALCLRLEASLVMPTEADFAPESSGTEGVFMNVTDAEQFSQLLLERSLQAFGA